MSEERITDEDAIVTRVFNLNIAGNQDFWLRMMASALLVSQGEARTIPGPYAADVDHEPAGQVNIVLHPAEYETDGPAFAIWSGPPEMECPYPAWAELLDDDDGA